MAMEIKNPSRMKYWFATDGFVIHTGKTGPGQVTTTGMTVVDEANSVQGLVRKLKPHADKLQTLPENGTVLGNTYYNFKGQPVYCVADHERGPSDPKNDPEGRFVTEDNSVLKTFAELIKWAVGGS